MKIQCDACNREEASIFYSADEAALCDACDKRVHHANKLASKHHRFSLLHPSYKEAPRCDICQERRAFLFCREDRAILCRECDLPIHTANHLTQKHSRFLLTGIKLSSSFSSISSSSSVAAVDSSDQAVKDKKKKKKKPVSAEMGSDFPTEKVAMASSTLGSKSEDLCTSSISEYLIKTLPGCNVEDLLGSSSPSDGLCEIDGLLPFFKADYPDNDRSLVSKDLAIWVPQVPPIHGPLYPAAVLDPKNGLELKESMEVGNNVRIGKRWNDDGFTVPQMNPLCKRSRPFWQIG